MSQPSHGSKLSHGPELSHDSQPSGSLLEQSDSLSEPPGRQRPVSPRKKRGVSASSQKLPDAQKLPDDEKQLPDEGEISFHREIVFLAAGRAEARRSGVSAEQIEDFLSEYLIGCCLSPDRANVALTCTCGANRARSFLRKERLWRQRVVLVPPQALLPLVESVPGTRSLTPEGWALLQALQERLQKTLGELTSLQQQMLYLRYVEQLSFVQIGSQTGHTPASVKMLVRRGQYRIASLLAVGDFPVEGEDLSRCSVCFLMVSNSSPEGDKGVP